MKNDYDATSNKQWGCLLHLSFNFAGGIKAYGGIREEFEPDEALLNKALKRMANSGMNTVLFNLDDALLWSSHPEIAQRNAWSPQYLYNKLNKIRDLGIKPIPQLNFSTSHDAWLGTYSRMVSTEQYYSVCSDLISEAIDIFDTPPYFHLGMDEESASHQKDRYDYSVIRQGDLWWNDLHFLVDEVEKHSTRAWVWSDYVWHHPDQFFNKMPKSVLQSNWYYGESFDLTKMDEDTKTRVNAYIKLDKQGYDQIPTAKFYEKRTHDDSIPHDSGTEGNLLQTVKFCNENIQDARLGGFLTTFWKPTTEKYRERILNGIEETGNCKRWYNKNKE